VSRAPVNRRVPASLYLFNGFSCWLPTVDQHSRKRGHLDTRRREEPVRRFPYPPTRHASNHRATPAICQNYNILPLGSAIFGASVILAQRSLLLSAC
jgi:hypothetical protein